MSYRFAYLGVILGCVLAHQLSAQVAVRPGSRRHLARNVPLPGAPLALSR